MNKKSCLSAPEPTRQNLDSVEPDRISDLSNGLATRLEIFFKRVSLIDLDLSPDRS